MKSAVREALEEVLEAEMEQALGAAKSERSSERLGYRSGYYARGLVTRIGKIEPAGAARSARAFSDRGFRALSAQREGFGECAVYIEGVSTRKVRKITEQLCGHSFSASAVSGVVKKLDRQLEAFAQRRLEESYRWLDSGCALREGARGRVIRSQAVLVAVGVGADGKRAILGVELANRESVRARGTLLAAAAPQGGGAGGERRARRPAAGDRAGAGGGRGNAATCTFCATRWIICRAFDGVALDL